MGNKIPFKTITSRITGLSTPVFGISWNPPQPERELVRALLTYLEDRRALYVPYYLEVIEDVERSVIQIRQELTNTLQSLSENSEAVPPVRALRAAC